MENINGLSFYLTIVIAVKHVADDKILSFSSCRTARRCISHATIQLLQSNLPEFISPPPFS